MRTVSLGVVVGLACVIGGCASAGSGRDVAAVVQDERARQAVAEAAGQGESAKAALAVASEASAPATDPPYRP